LAPKRESGGLVKKMSGLHEKIHWAIQKANEEYDAGNKEGAVRLLGYIRKIYPGHRIPAWAREKIEFAYDENGRITVY
jgi:hypothetical protein